MKCRRPMAHRPKMEGVINCKACEREATSNLVTRRDMNGRLYFPWMWVWAKKEQE